MIIGNARIHRESLSNALSRLLQVNSCSFPRKDKHVNFTSLTYLQRLNRRQ